MSDWKNPKTYEDLEKSSAGLLAAIALFRKTFHRAPKGESKETWNRLLGIIEGLSKKQKLIVGIIRKEANATEMLVETMEDVTTILGGMQKCLSQLRAEIDELKVANAKPKRRSASRRRKPQD